MLLLSQVGVESVVVERARAKCQSSPRGLGVWPNGQGVLRHLGLLGELSNVSRLNPPASYRDWRGNWLSSASDSEQQRTRVMTLTRDDLVKVRVVFQLLLHLEVLHPAKLLSLTLLGVM